MFVEQSEQSGTGALARPVLAFVAGGAVQRPHRTDPPPATARRWGILSHPLRWCLLAVLSVLFALVWAATSR